ncbi:fungal-specific transcription factor domain-containing protein [Biscogniauxia marginata]|nr:fungal-specific transcription factor domain-containing protein [Biscogniauxia marginata]
MVNTSTSIQDTTPPMGSSFAVSPPNGNSNNSPVVSTPQDHVPSRASASLNSSPATGSHPFPSGGPITLDPSATPSSVLNPRSCVTCRRRKVRCDKHMPCGNCRKAQIQCVFPAPGRAPRRPRVKDPNAPPKQTSEREIELMKRLRKLEGIVEDLSGQIEIETARHGGSSGGESPEAAVESIQERERRKQTAAIYSENIASGYPPLPSRKFTGDSTYSTVKSPSGEVNKDFGRLVLNEKGKTRYVSSSFWSKINDEVGVRINELRAETQRLTDEDSEDSDGGSTPATIYQYTDQHVDHHGFVLGYSSSDVDLRKLHPLPSQIPFIWQVYTENVDPLVKILHVPSMSKIIREQRSNMSNIPPGMEALLFSIYYAAITSMEEEEVKENFGAEKGQLIHRYRFATEQALAKANFLTSSELVVAQAFVLFLVLVRRYDDTRFAWTLTGLAIRMAQSLGIHREGTHFENLSPFDVEMRRRLWWAICVVDLRSAEDQGTELTISDRTFDTQYPLNINDADINPDMTDFPEERKGATDMTFCLIRYEICSLARKMHFAANSMSSSPNDSLATLQERENMLIEMYERIDAKYLKACADKESDVLNWIAATIARLIMAKMSLVIYQPMLMPSTGQDLSVDVRDRLFMSAVEVVEYNKVLNGEPRCRPWRWLFQTYTQWHAVAYLLLEVCRRPWTASVERGWMALNATFQMVDPADFARPAVWVPLRKLMLKAKRHREEEVQRLRADPQAAQELDINECNKVPPASFQHLPSSVRNVLAQERWRKLVGTKGPEKPAYVSCRKADTPKESPNSQASKEDEPLVSNDQYQYIEQTLALPCTNYHDFLTAAFQSDDLARTASFNGGAMEQPGGSKLPQHNSVPIENLNARGNQIYPAQAQGEVIPSNGEPMDSILDDHPPPWLWGDSWTNGFPPNNVANAPAADQDINMDTEDDFNWQSWMDSELALGRTGFTGGI